MCVVCMYVLIESFSYVGMLHVCMVVCVHVWTDFVMYSAHHVFMYVGVSYACMYACM